jgi:hypothetical protein
MNYKILLIIVFRDLGKRSFAISVPLLVSPVWFLMTAGRLLGGYNFIQNNHQHIKALDRPLAHQFISIYSPSTH